MTDGWHDMNHSPGSYDSGKGAVPRGMLRTLVLSLVGLLLVMGVLGWLIQ